jgi:hypothetical protein
MPPRGYANRMTQQKWRSVTLFTAQGLDLRKA